MHNILQVQQSMLFLEHVTVSILPCKSPDMRLTTIVFISLGIISSAISGLNLFLLSKEDSVF